MAYSFIGVIGEHDDGDEGWYHKSILEYSAQARITIRAVWIREPGIKGIHVERPSLQVGSEDAFEPIVFPRYG